jgi:hypothetical protein
MPYSPSKNSVSVQVAAGFSAPVTATIPTSLLSRSLKEVVAEAVRAQLSGSPAARNLLSVLSGTTSVFEVDGKYYASESTASDVIDDTVEEEKSVIRVMKPQRGGREPTWSRPA